MKWKCTRIPLTVELGWSLGDKDFTVTVSGKYYPGLPARTSGPPEDCYPEEPSDFDCDTLVCSDGEEHPELYDDELFWEAVYITAAETYEDMLDDQRAERDADRSYWRDYDTGRS